MAETYFRHGNPLMVDFTPGSDVAAGEVVPDATAGNLQSWIAHRDIKANTLGAVAAGGGVYEGVADGAIAMGAKVYWDDGAGKVTGTAAANALLGYCTMASGADGDPIYFKHSPDS